LNLNACDFYVSGNLKWKVYRNNVCTLNFAVVHGSLMQENLPLGQHFTVHTNGNKATKEGMNMYVYRETGNCKRKVHF
jgi:hypothetical protein